MSKKAIVAGAVAALALVSSVQDTNAFAPTPFVAKTNSMARFAEESKPTEAVFVPDTPEPAESDDSSEIGLDTVEKLGRGAAKVRISFAWEPLTVDI